MTNPFVPLDLDTMILMKDCSDEAFRRIARAAMKYALGHDDCMEMIREEERLIFGRITAQIDRNNDISQKRREAAYIRIQKQAMASGKDIGKYAGISKNQQNSANFSKIQQNASAEGAENESEIGEISKNQQISAKFSKIQQNSLTPDEGNIPEKEKENEKEREREKEKERSKEKEREIEREKNKERDICACVGAGAGVRVREGRDAVQGQSVVQGRDAAPQSNPQAGKVKRFVVPSVEEVAAYCRERGNSVEPERFVDFYASKGWKVGNQPMKDWKACVRTWERNGSAGASGAVGASGNPAGYGGQRNQTAGGCGWVGTRRTVSAQEYTQREYSDREREEAAMERLIRMYGEKRGLTGGERA